MSTVKISQLPIIAAIDANTANTLFAGVDIPTGSTGKMTAQVLARGLYSNEILNVGGNPVLYPNVTAQFASTSNTYLQINLQNFNSNGSSDIVASTSDSDNANNYVDMGINGKTFNEPAYTSMKPYDAYVYSHGPNHTSYQGNLVIGTASSDANIVFIAGGTLSGNIVGRISKDTFDFLKDTRVTGDLMVSSAYVFPDTTRQVTAANTVFLQANDFTTLTAAKSYTDSANTIIQNQFTYTAGLNVTQNTNISIIQSVDLTQNAYITAAFDKANNALANTSGTFNGDLFVKGNLSAYSISTSNLVSFISSTTPATRSVVEIIGSEFGTQQAPSNDGYMLHITGKANTPTRIVTDAFGANAYVVLAGRSARGTAAAPLAIANNDVLMRISGNGWGSTGYSPLGVSRIDFVASENFTDIAKGSRIEFFNTISGANSLSKIASFNATEAVFTGLVNPVKGFIFTPKLPAGNQTAITIDYAADSTIKANLVADLTISHSNYTAGKIVEVWLVNVDNTNHSVTHGCAALRSTNKSTTFTISSQSSAYMRFFSIDGDNANTFVSIVA